VWREGGAVRVIVGRWRWHAFSARNTIYSKTLFVRSCCDSTEFRLQHITALLRFDHLECFLTDVYHEHGIYLVQIKCCHSWPTTHSHSSNSAHEGAHFRPPTSTIVEVTTCKSRAAGKNIKSVYDVP